jgi:hypothetical protein
MVGRANPIQAQASVMMLFKALGLHWIAWNPWFWKRRRRCGSCSSTDNPISPKLLLLLPRLNWGVACVLQQHGLLGLLQMLISRPYLPAVEQWRSGGAEDRARRDDIGYWKDVVDGKKQRKGLPEFGEVGPCGPRFWSQPYGHLPTSLRC